MHERHTRRHALQALLALAAAPALAADPAIQVQPWPVGQPLPPTQALDLQGRQWELPLAGKAVVLNFWASWCEPCRSEMPSLQQLADFYAGKLAVLAVNFRERPSTAARFAKNAGFDMPILLDPQGEIAKRWNVRVFPTSVLIGADGKPRWRVQGELDWTGPQAGKMVEALFG